MTPGPLPIVAATSRYVVVEKPPGMLSVPGKGPHKQDCVCSRVAAMFPRATGPLVVHRLDMETSGLLVFGLDPDAQRALSWQFESRRVEKAYIALLDGEVRCAGECGVVSLPLRTDLDRRPVQIVDWAHGRPARTRWRIIGREIDRTRVRLEPITGRTHQLRVHAATPAAPTHSPNPEHGGLGCPILGDPLYGDADSAPRLMLHAAWLTFLDPDSGRRVEFESPVPF